MGEIEIQIPDSPSSRPPGRRGLPRHPLVALVLLPAALVAVLVGLFVLFGAITGDEASPEENIERLLDGGANERKQAAFELVRQALESWEVGPADAGPGATPDAWTVDAALLVRIRSARRRWERIESPDDVPIPLALSVILARMGETEGVADLVEMTGLTEELDPGGRFRSYAAFVLGTVGESLCESDRALASGALVELLSGDDQGLRNVAVIALQTLPAPGTLPALRRALGDDSVEIRLNAALSLERLGEAFGARVLQEMLWPEPYRDERRLQPEKWAHEERISASRIKALEALVRLGEPPAGEDLERLAREDADPLVRERALRLIGGPPPP